MASSRDLIVSAVGHLKKTTVGWNRVAGYPPAKLAGTEWGKALADLDGGLAALPPNPAPAPPPPPAPPAPAGVVSVGDFQAALKPGAVFKDITVAGSVHIAVPDVTLQNVTLRGIDFDPGSDGSRMIGCNARAFYISGPDDIVIQETVFDGQGDEEGCIIWDKPAGDTPKRWKLQGCTFRNFYAPDPAHTQALYLGYSEDGLVESCHFDNNGNTAHVFLTWFGNLAKPSMSYPRRICIRANTFGPTHTAWYSINVLAEVPTASGICIEPGQPSVKPLSNRNDLERVCL